MNVTASLQPNQWCKFPLVGLGADGITPQPIHGTLAMSDYNQAYAVITADGQGAIVPKSTPAVGQSSLISVVMSPTDAATGNALPSQQIDVTLFGPAAPTQLATSAIFGTVVIVDGINSDTPPDPHPFSGHNVVSF